MKQLFASLAAASALATIAAPAFAQDTTEAVAEAATPTLSPKQINACMEGIEIPQGATGTLIIKNQIADGTKCILKATDFGTESEVVITAASNSDGSDMVGIQASEKGFETHVTSADYEISATEDKDFKGTTVYTFKTSVTEEDMKELKTLPGTLSTTNGVTSITFNDTAGDRLDDESYEKVAALRSNTGNILISNASQNLIAGYQQILKLNAAQIKP